MGTNFNVGSFNAINTNEPKKSNSKNGKGSNEDLRKRLMLMGAAILGGAIVLFLLLFLLSLFMNKNYTYDDIENIMVSAAESYFSDHPKRLPRSDTQRVEIDVDTLVASEYMKEMVDYTGEEITCSGKVSVQTNGNDYLYTPRLDCGEDYVTQSLREVLTKKVVTEGYGLYEVGDSYVYRGEDVKNYLQLDASLWRIVKVTEDGEIMLILEDKPYSSVAWDNRYNSQIGYNIGINTYSTSRVKESLDKYYKSKYNENSSFKSEAILSDDDRSKTVTFDLCTGKRSTSDTTKDNSVECAEISEGQKIGLLTASDYMMASIDTNCNTILNQTCQNYNYLVTDYKWWLVTATANSTKEAYGVDGGVVESINTSSYMYPRAVIMLNSNVLFKSGKGTVNKPYKIK